MDLKSNLGKFVLILTFFLKYTVNVNAQTAQINNNQDYTLENVYLAPFFGNAIPLGISFTQTVNSRFYDVVLIQNRTVQYGSGGAVIGATIDFKFLTYKVGPVPRSNTVVRRTYGDYNNGDPQMPTPYNGFEVGHGEYHFLTGSGMWSYPFVLRVPASQ